jgi:hypothetical protein
MWHPPIAWSAAAQTIAARTRQARKFCVFLRACRHARLDADFQNTLTTSSRPGSAGHEPGEAGLLALATLLQAEGHGGERDAGALTVMAKRWQRGLDCRGAEHPPVSQGTLGHVRLRRIAHHLDQTLLDRTGALADKPGGGGARHLRAVRDAPPRCGARRVEDTLTLLGPARRLAAHGRDPSVEAVTADAGLTLLGPRSLKAARELDWGEPRAGAGAWPGPGGGRTRATRAGAATRPGDPGPSAPGGPGAQRPEYHAGDGTRP